MGVQTSGNRVTAGNRFLRVCVRTRARKRTTRGYLVTWGPVAP